MCYTLCMCIAGRINQFRFYCIHFCREYAQLCVDTRIHLYPNNKHVKLKALIFTVIQIFVIFILRLNNSHEHRAKHAWISQSIKNACVWIFIYDEQNRDHERETAGITVKWHVHRTDSLSKCSIAYYDLDTTPSKYVHRSHNSKQNLSYFYLLLF